MLRELLGEQRPSLRGLDGVVYYRSKNNVRGNKINGVY